MTPNDKLPEEKALGYSLKGSWINYPHPHQGKMFYPGTGQAEVYSRYLDGYNDGATAWAGWKVKYDEVKSSERAVSKAYAQSLIDRDELRSQAQAMADALDGLLDWHKNTIIGYGFASRIDAAIKALQQFKDGTKGKEVVRPCPRCGKELSRDRNLCCRECGKEVGDA